MRLVYDSDSRLEPHGYMADDEVSVGVMVIETLEETGQELTICTEY